MRTFVQEPNQSRKQVCSSFVRPKTTPAPHREHHRILRLQRAIGNQSMLRHIGERMMPGLSSLQPALGASPFAIQRLSATEKAENLKSLKFSGNARLEAAFDNSPAMGLGDPDRNAVRLVQEGLVAAGFAMPKSTKPSGEMDGIFGSETQEVVKQFQLTFADEGLVGPSGQPDGRVGRRTLGKLDELAGGSAPVPPQPRHNPRARAPKRRSTLPTRRVWRR